MSAGEQCHPRRRARRPRRTARSHAGALPGSLDLPPATVARLPVYLRELNLLSRSGVELVSSGALAEAVGVAPAQLRKDLSHLGSYGTRGVGLRRRRAPGPARSRDGLRARVAGGHRRDREPGSGPGRLLGLLQPRLPDRGARRPQPGPDRTEINGIEISDLADLEEVVARTKAVIAVLATPGRGRPGRGRPARVSGRHQHSQLRSDRAHRAGRRHRTEGGPRSGAPDPGVPRAAQVDGRARPRLANPLAGSRRLDRWTVDRCRGGLDEHSGRQRVAQDDQRGRPVPGRHGSGDRDQAGRGR